MVFSTYSARMNDKGSKITGSLYKDRNFSMIVITRGIITADTSPPTTLAENGHSGIAANSL